MTNKINKNKTKKCDLCGAEISVDKNFLGQCEHCGWANVEIAIDCPHDVFLPNYVTYNRAKMLYKNGARIFPDFDEFLEVLEAKERVRITIEDKLYKIYLVGDGVELLDVSNHHASSYDTIDEFKGNATIGKLRLYDSWHKVDRVDCL